MISVKQFFRSLKRAWRGIGDVARSEQSFRIQLVVSALVLLLSAYLPLLMWERILLLLLIAAVLVLEIINSILERLADAVHPRLHPMIREVKDMMAGAVLLTSATAAIVGFVLLGPHVLAKACVILDPLALALCHAW